MKRLIIFDFDGTLTRKDTLRPFVTFIVIEQKCGHKLFMFYLLLIKYKVKLFTDLQFKEAFLNLFIKGQSVKDVEKNVSMFLDDHLPCLMNNIVFEKLKGHVAAGEDVYLASANFDFILAPLINKWKLTGIISTATEVKNDCYTGRIIGNTCKGEEKFIKIKEILGEEAVKAAIAYGDDEDSLLLHSVGEGINVSCYD